MADDTVRITITRWKDHQHYGKRNPPWIKLHSKLLENAEFGVLSGDAVKLLVILWLLAAKEGTDGEFSTTVAKLEWRTRFDITTLAHLVKSLSDNDFLTYASAMLDHCYRGASALLDTEVRETEKAEDRDAEFGRSSDLPERAAPKMRAVGGGK